MAITIKNIEKFLHEVDNTFPIPLSKKQDLHLFACKLYEKATICAEVKGEKIVSMVAGYTENVVENKAYISIVATISESKRKGYASKLLLEFISICKKKKLSAVHLYVVKNNIYAVNMYKNLGFVEWNIPSEPRKDDMHMIYNLSVEENK